LDDLMFHRIEVQDHCPLATGRHVEMEPLPSETGVAVAVNVSPNGLPVEQVLE
jgi:hypothetical protein